MAANNFNQELGNVKTEDGETEDISLALQPLNTEDGEEQITLYMLSSNTEDGEEIIFSTHPPNNEVCEEEIQEIKSIQLSGNEVNDEIALSTQPLQNESIDMSDLINGNQHQVANNSYNGQTYFLNIENQPQITNNTNGHTYLLNLQNQSFLVTTTSSGIDSINQNFNQALVSQYQPSGNIYNYLLAETQTQLLVNNNMGVSSYQANNKHQKILPKPEFKVMSLRMIESIEDQQEVNHAQQEKIFKHLGLSKSSKKPICTTGQKKSSSISNLKNRSLLHTGLRQFLCPWCQENFTTLSQLNKHKLVHSEEKVTRKQTSRKKRRKLAALKNFQWRPKKTYKCDLCQKHFKKLSYLKRHLLIHSGERPYMCNVCSKSFNQASTLKSHQLIHAGIRTKKYKSKTGQISFSTSSKSIQDKQVKKHTQQEKILKHLGHSKSSKKPICTTGQKKLSSFSNLKNLSLLHTGLRQFKCPLCQENFTTLSQLNKHKLVHSGEKVTRKQTGQKKCRKLAILKKSQWKPKITLKCDLCQKHFISLSHLKRHLFIHSGERPYKCKVCSKSFNQSATLNRHQLSHGIHKKMYKSKTRIISFSTASKLKSHKLVAKTQKTSKSQDCQTGSTKSLGSETLMLAPASTGKKKYKCPICTKYFRSTSHIYTHLLNVHNAKPDKCQSPVNQVLDASPNLKKPKMIYTGIKRFSCDICQKNFTRSSDVIRHQSVHLRESLKTIYKPRMIHTSRKPVKCENCQKSFSSSYGVKIHRLTECRGKRSKYRGQKYFATSTNLFTDAKEKQFKCNVCQRQFSQRSTLANHQLLHTGVKPFKCKLCGRRFSQTGSLKTHLLLHTGEKPFRCQICQKGFTNSSNLTRHQSVHTGFQPYQCPLCPSRFTQSTSMKHHLEAHTGYTFQCPVCLKAYTTKQSMLAHCRIHKGGKILSRQIKQEVLTHGSSLNRDQSVHSVDKPYHCHVCSSRFAQSSSLKKHLLTHTGTDQKSFQCQTCQKGFTYFGCWKRHQCLNKTNTNQRVQKVSHPVLFSESQFPTYPPENKCQVCDKVFPSRKSLKSHQVVHLSDYKFQCILCNLKCSNLKEIKKHLIKHLKV